MGVLSSRELARTYETELRTVTSAQRRWIVICDDNAITAPVTIQEVANHLGLGDFCAAHPEYGWLGVRKFTFSENYENNPYHVLMVADYGFCSDNDKKIPSARDAEWAFELVTGEQVPALYFFSGSGNNTKKPLTNSANDYFEGLTFEETLTQARIVKNYTTRPDSVINAFGYVNSDTFAGAPAHHCRHAGSRIEKVSEAYGSVLYNYWRVESTVLFRSTSWNLLLPDVGWNYLASGQKRRGLVFDFENAEWVPSPNPVGLNGSGGQTTGEPAILDRRVYPETSFVSLFGNPPA